MNKYKSFINDFVLNLISNAVLLIIIQLVIFPLISDETSQVRFGEIVALYGINNVIVIFLGNTLNNIRLLNQDNDAGYSILLYGTNMTAIFLILVFTQFYGATFSKIDITLLIIFTILSNSRAYLTSFYRIKLKYKSILIQNLWIAVGYFLGLFVYKNFYDQWLIMFLLGELFGMGYMIYTKNPLLKDFYFNKNYDKKIASKFYRLSFANSISSVLNYLDRFTIIPILGSYNMSIFYAASSISKIFTMLITPMNNVLLTYTSNSREQLNRKNLLRVTSLLITGCVPLFFVINFISKIIIEMLYPSLYSNAAVLIPVISVGILTNSLASFLNPFILKYYYINTQMIIQIIYGTFYVFLSIVLSVFLGVKGFAIAFSCSMIIKLVLQIIVIKKFKLADNLEEL